ncbi:hypothetical protein GCM10010211_70040 [Streptomyces albospinus]|uniref:Uncharacterized protein n=1 Tax=Streptomyces albospinus TaxID=285515 RepID=A0ABQ2VL42_9ACTN|nr:hypothetical protein GCM10010211_70040 [Streptomyces albospinus]
MGERECRTVAPGRCVEAGRGSACSGVMARRCSLTDGRGNPGEEWRSRARPHTGGRASPVPVPVSYGPGATAPPRPVRSPPGRRRREIGLSGHFSQTSANMMHALFTADASEATP